jgi:hypothetical protein
MGGKTSYMGVLGHQIDLDPAPLDAPNDVKEVISKLVAVAMIRTRQREDVPLHVELIVKNGPENIQNRMESNQVIPVNLEFEENLIQFQAQIPNVPVINGMEIMVNFCIYDYNFGARMIINRP